MSDLDDHLAGAENFTEATQKVEQLLSVDQSTGRIVITGDVFHLGIDTEILQLLLSSLDEFNSMVAKGEVKVADLGIPIPSKASKRPDAPTITSAQPVQFHLRNPVPHIAVSWTMSEACDKYHFIWTSGGPTFAEEELTPGRSFGSSFKIPNTQAHLTYTCKVQGCQSRIVGHDNCSPFSSERSVTMPPNTRSLRTFLTISGVPLRLRSLGVPVVGNGVRTMMRV